MTQEELDAYAAAPQSVNVDGNVVTRHPLKDVAAYQAQSTDDSSMSTQSAVTRRVSAMFHTMSPPGTSG
jgi:hypothetical protein